MTIGSNATKDIVLNIIKYFVKSPPSPREGRPNKMPNESSLPPFPYVGSLQSNISICSQIACLRDDLEKLKTRLLVFESKGKP